MAVYALNEPIIEALVQKLRDGLDDAIDEVNAQVTDGVYLDSVDNLLDYVPVPAELNRFPTIGFSDGITRFVADRGANADALHEVSCVIFVQAVDQRTLAVLLRRYLRATLSVILADRNAGPAYSIEPVMTKPGPTLGRDDNPRDWMSYVGFVLACRSDEEL